jgi:hypothetical protein
MSNRLTKDTFHYILEGKKAIPEPDLFKWARWFQTENRHVVLDSLPNGVQVSTVFLGLDHGYGHGDPILFETMIFGGEHNQYTERYSTYEQAEEGHKRAVELVFSI